MATWLARPVDALNPKAVIEQVLLFWLFTGVLEVSLGILSWYRSSYGTDFDNSEIAGPVESDSTPSLGFQSWDPQSTSPRGQTGVTKL